MIKMDLPSVDRDSIRVDAQDGMLSVFAEKKDWNSGSNGCYCRHERRPGHFGRSFRLGSEMVEHDKIDAHYEDGVLTITIPKSEQSGSKVHHIPITMH